MQDLFGTNKKYKLENKSIWIKTLWFTQEIEGHPFRKFYIVDLRRLDEEKIKLVFKEFNTIQDELVKDDYFNRTAQNFYLYFLCDSKQKYQSIASIATEDTRYAFKLLISKEEFSIILDENADIANVNPNEKIIIKGKDFNVGNFNLIYGGNGSGKTNLLKELGDYYHVIPKNLTNVGAASGITLYDDIYIHAFVSESDYMYNYYLYLMSIIRASKNTNMPILLDDFGWNGLGQIDQLKIITLLNEAAFNNKTFITASQEKIKKIVKRNVYKPNIIEL